MHVVNSLLCYQHKYLNARNALAIRVEGVQGLRLMRFRAWGLGFQGQGSGSRA